MQSTFENPLLLSQKDINEDRTLIGNVAHFDYSTNLNPHVKLLSRKMPDFENQIKMAKKKGKNKLAEELQVESESIIPLFDIESSITNFNRFQCSGNKVQGTRLALRRMRT